MTYQLDQTPSKSNWLERVLVSGATDAASVETRLRERQVEVRKIGGLEISLRMERRKIFLLAHLVS
jgi:hypothetical protein